MLNIYFLANVLQLEHSHLTFLHMFEAEIPFIGILPIFLSHSCLLSHLGAAAATVPYLLQPLVHDCFLKPQARKWAEDREQLVQRPDIFCSMGSLISEMNISALGFIFWRERGRSSGRGERERPHLRERMVRKQYGDPAQLEWGESKRDLQAIVSTSLGSLGVHWPWHSATSAILPQTGQS